MARSWFKGSFLIVVLFSFLTQAAEVPGCGAFLSGKIGFNVSPSGKLTLDVAESRYKIVENTVNGLAQLILGKPLQLAELSKVTHRLLADESKRPYFVKLAEAFSLSAELDAAPEFLSKIPRKGPTLVVMNHPANGRETIAVAAAISIVRPDLRVALTVLLKDYPGMSDNAIFLNPSSSASAKIYNKGQREKMDQWIKSGGILLVHPSGEVSSLRHTNDGQYAMDPNWKYGVAKLIQENPEVQVVPVFLDGQASDTFQKVKNIKPYSLSNAVGPIFHIRELAEGQGQAFPVNIAQSMKSSDLVEKFNGDLEAMMSFLRSLTYSLKGRMEAVTEINYQDNLVKPVAQDLVQKDLARMKILFKGADYVVMSAQGHEIPHLLNEIGRLREATKRMTLSTNGQETGKDPLDRDYQHIIVYHPKKRKIISAFRAQSIDELIKSTGLNEVSTLGTFEYSNLLLSELGDSIEFSEYFVNHEDGIEFEAQKKIASEAIEILTSQVVQKSRMYSQILTTVTLPGMYSDVSRAITIAYLTKLASNLKDHVKPRISFAPKSAVLKEALSLVPSIHSINELNQIVRDIDGRDLPDELLALSQLGAEFLGFGVNPHNGAVEGLVMIRTQSP